MLSIIQAGTDGLKDGQVVESLAITMIVHHIVLVRPAPSTLSPPHLLLKPSFSSEAYPDQVIDEPACVVLCVPLFSDLLKYENSLRDKSKNL